MTHWFDRRAAAVGGVTPDQARKMRAINDALAGVDRRFRDHLASIDTFDRSARKASSGRVFAEWPARIAGLEVETLRARDRLDRLDTGMRAQVRIRAALTELASGFAAWHRGLSSSDRDVVRTAIASMERHFFNAQRLGKSGLADLRAGR